MKIKENMFQLKRNETQCATGINSWADIIFIIHNRPANKYPRLKDNFILR
jgi:hypothetical protein